LDLFKKFFFSSFLSDSSAAVFFTYLGLANSERISKRLLELFKRRGGLNEKFAISFKGRDRKYLKILSFYKIIVQIKQWPLAPNSRDSLNTRANLARRVTFFSKMAFGECRRVCRVPKISGKGHFGECEYSLNLCESSHCFSLVQITFKEMPK
jgi:hypothetical protein